MSAMLAGRELANCAAIVTAIRVRAGRIGEDLRLSKIAAASPSSSLSSSSSSASASANANNGFGFQPIPPPQHGASASAFAAKQLPDFSAPPRGVLMGGGKGAKNNGKKGDGKRSASASPESSASGKGVGHATLSISFECYYDCIDTL